MEKNRQFGRFAEIEIRDFNKELKKFSGSVRLYPTNDYFSTRNSYFFFG